MFEVKANSSMCRSDDPCFQPVLQLPRPKFLAFFSSQDPFFILDDPNFAVLVNT